MKNILKIAFLFAIVCSMLCISGTVACAEEDPASGQENGTGLELETYDVTASFSYDNIYDHGYSEEIEVLVTKGTVTDVSSSNERVATTLFYTPYMQDYQLVVIYADKPGTAVITVTGSEGDVVHVNVTVDATLSFSENSIVFDHFFYNNTENYGFVFSFPCDLGWEYYHLISPNDDQVIKVTSKNTGVVKLVSHNESGYPGPYWEVIPVHVGRTVLVLQDPLGQKAEIPVTVTAQYMKEYIYYYSVMDTAEYGDTYLYGRTFPYTAVKLTFAGKSYSAKTNKFGDFKFKVPVKKIGTKIKYTIKYKGASLVLNERIEKPTMSLSVQKITKKSRKIKVTARYVHKGDVIKVKIGKKTYKYKLKSNKKKVTHKFKIKRSKAGKKITVTVVNKYKQKLTSRSSIVYYAMKVRKNMTKKQCKLVPGWAHPCRVYGWQNWETWWYDKNGDGYVDDTFLQFHNGKLDSWSY